jgi:hypothetical protein
MVSRSRLWAFSKSSAAALTLLELVNVTLASELK